MTTCWLHLLNVLAVLMLVMCAAPTAAEDGIKGGTAGPATINLSFSFTQPEIEEDVGPLSLGAPGGRPAARLVSAA